MTTPTQPNDQLPDIIWAKPPTKGLFQDGPSYSFWNTFGAGTKYIRADLIEAKPQEVDLAELRKNLEKVIWAVRYHNPGNTEKAFPAYNRIIRDLDRAEKGTQHDR